MEVQDSRGDAAGGTGSVELSEKAQQLIEASEGQQLGIEFEDAAEPKSFGGEQGELDFGSSGTEAFKKVLQDPKASHELYYDYLDKLKRAWIPTGDRGQPIREEINRFCKEGHDTGRDVRQARTPLLREAIEEMMAWRETGTGVMELLARFKELNKRWGVA